MDSNGDGTVTKIRGRRIVPVSFKGLAALVSGNVQAPGLTNAPGDLRVLGVAGVRDSTVFVVIDSEEFALARAPYPVVEFRYQQGIVRVPFEETRIVAPKGVG